MPKYPGAQHCTGPHLPNGAGSLSTQDEPCSSVAVKAWSPVDPLKNGTPLPGFFPLKGILFLVKLLLFSTRKSKVQRKVQRDRSTRSVTEKVAHEKFNETYNESFPGVNDRGKVSGELSGNFLLAVFATCFDYCFVDRL